MDKYVQLSDGKKIPEWWIRKEIDKLQKKLEYWQSRYDIFKREYNVWDDDYAQMVFLRIKNLQREIDTLKTLLRQLGNP